MSRTRTLLSLQAKLWGRALAKSPQQLLGNLLIAAFIISQCILLGVWSASEYRNHGDASMFVITMALGSVLYLIVSALSPDSESQVEPTQLATLPLSAKDILPGLFATKFLQTGSLIATVNTIVMAIFGWQALGADNWIYGTAWALSCVGQLLLTLALGEAISLFMSRAGSTKFKERLNFISGLAVMVIVIVIVTALNALSASADPIQGVDFSALLPYAAWLPFGAFANSAARLADPALAGPVPLLSLAIALVTLLAAAWLWYTALRNLIRTPLRATSSQASSRATRHSIVLPWAPHNQLGALYSQAIKYWLRDSRQLLPLLTFPLMAGMYIALSQVSGDSFTSWFSLFFLSVAGGSLLPNSIGMDGPTSWVHLSVGVTAKNYVWSRWLAAFTVMIGWMVLFSVVLGFMNGWTHAWVLSVASALYVLALTLSFGLLVAGTFASPTPPPSVSAFRQKNNGSFASTILMMVFTLIAGIAVLPGVVAYIVLENLWLGILLQLPITAGLVWLIMFFAAKRLDKNWVTLFNKVKHWI